MIICKDFSGTGRKILLPFLSALLSCWLVFAPVTSAGSATLENPQQEQTYIITEQELTQLEQNLAQLRSVNQALQMELAAQQRELHVLREESSRLVSQLQTLKQQSQTQESSLTNANRLLDRYATEAKRERLRIKAQRNTWISAAVLACIGIAIK